MDSCTRNHGYFNLSPLMTEILKHPDLSWLQLLMPHGQAMAPGPQAALMAITWQWQGHPDALDWEEERLRDHGAVWGSQPHAQLTCCPARTWLAAEP